MWKFYTGDDSPGFKMYVPLVLNPDAARVTGFFSVSFSLLPRLLPPHTTAPKSDTNGFGATQAIF